MAFSNSRDLRCGAEFLTTKYICFQRSCNRGAIAIRESESGSAISGNQYREFPEIIPNRRIVRSKLYRLYIVLHEFKKRSVRIIWHGGPVCMPWNSVVEWLRKYYTKGIDEEYRNQNVSYFSQPFHNITPPWFLVKWGIKYFEPYFLSAKITYIVNFV